MSILIKGMEMPTRCGRCDMRIPTYLDDGMFDHYECCITAAIIDNLGEKMEDCPLIPVPEHGDLIDRDELMKHKGNCYDADGHLLYAVGTGSIMCAPAIIEEER